MDELLARIADNLAGRLSGPLHLRLLLQPAVALFFGIRDGLGDARRGAPAYFWAIFSDPSQRRPLLREGWLVSSAELGTDFGSLWFLYVVRPVSIGLLLVWLWRLLLLTGLFWRISHLDLQLAPSHPDRFGGLGMLELLSWCQIPFALAVSSALSGRIATDMVRSGTALSGYALMVAVFVAIMVLLLLAPQMAYAPVLLRTRIHGLLEYGELLSRHGRLVRQRWILGRQITEDPLLDAPELGPSVDVNSLYQAVAAINPLAVGLRSLLAAVFATLLPLLPLVLLQFPLTEVLLRLAGALF